MGLAEIINSGLVALGPDNQSWAIGAVYLITGILTTSVASNIQSIGTYFTNWSLLIQLAAYFSFIRDFRKNIWLYDLSAVLVWTVAISFSLVTAISDTLRNDMYELYGFWGFWFGNFIIHYLPLLFNYVVRPRALIFSSCVTDCCFSRLFTTCF